MAAPTSASEKTPSPTRFAKFAAIGSLLIPPVIVFICYAFFEYIKAHGHTPLAAIGTVIFFGFTLMMAGLALGILALTQTKKSGNNAIFKQALIGVALNGLLLIALFAIPIVIGHTVGKQTPLTPQARLDAAAKKLAEAPAGENRFYALDDAAKESFNLGKIDDASNYARELLKLAPTFQGNWNYGNAIQDGNLVLGRIAVRDGHIEDAKHYLLDSVRTAGSPQMNSFGPNMSLANDLLEKGERDTVLQYFELCRNFWTMDYGKLNQWRDEVKAGTTPNFAANLVY